MGLKSGMIEFEIGRTHCRRRHDQWLGPERRDCVGEQHLADNALAVLISGAQVGVPVAQLALAEVLLLRVQIVPAPFVEPSAIFWIKIFAVLTVASARVSVRRDQDIRIFRHADFSRFARILVRN